MILSYTNIHDFMFSKLFKTMLKCTENNLAEWQPWNDLDVYACFTTGGPKVTCYEHYCIASVVITKTSLQILMLKFVVKAHWNSFPSYVLFFAHSFLSNSGYSRGISMGEHPNEKNTGLSLKQPKNPRKDSK